MPTIRDHVLPSSCGLGELRDEPLDPSEDRDVIDLDAALGEEPLDIAGRTGRTGGTTERRG